MKDALSAAWELISTYDPSGQSVIDRTSGLDLEDGDSGIGSDDQDDQDDQEDINPPLLASSAGRRAGNRRLRLTEVKHIHATSRRILDGCVARYRQRVEHYLAKDQVHTAEADLQQLMTYAHQRKERYGIDYDKIQMQELLAKIYKMQGKHKQVFAVLRKLVPTESSEEEQHTIEHSRHYHTIAETYYEVWGTEENRQDLFDAQLYALTAFTIRDQLEAGDELLVETAALLADI
jgi:hypothetical protein